VNLVQGAPSVLEQVAFIILASGALVGALATITRKNAVAAVMSLVATFLAVAGLFATLSAHFLAVLQVLVYAGAIMVLFIFVVMVVNRDEEAPIALRGLFVRAAGVLATGYLFYRVAWLVMSARGQGVLSASRAYPIPGFGEAASVGRLLFADFLFPFEAISLLLLVAVVGGVLLSRPDHPAPSGGST
jgi:NADH-quinone oxidoreductase subunit J